MNQQKDIQVKNMNYNGIEEGLKNHLVSEVLSLGLSHVLAIFMGFDFKRLMDLPFFYNSLW